MSYVLLVWRRVSFASYSFAITVVLENGGSWAIVPNHVFFCVLSKSR